MNWKTHGAWKVKANGAYNDTVFADVNVGPDDGRVDHRVLADEDVVADVQREKSHPARFKFTR